VFGSVGLLRVSFLLTEIKHLVVHSSFRRFGIAKKLLVAALEETDTPLVFATIRETNTASRALFKQAGFTEVVTSTVNSHKIVLLLKKNEKNKVHPSST